MAVLLAGDVRWQRVVVAYPYKDGCCHDTVIVVALYGSHLLAVLLEFIEVEFMGSL